MLPVPSCTPRPSILSRADAHLLFGSEASVGVWAQSWVPSESVCSHLEMPVVRNTGLTLAPAVFKALCVARESEVLRQGGRCVRRWTGAQLEGRLVPLDLLRSETGTSWHLGWSVPSHLLGLCSPSLSFSACFLSAPALISLLSIYLFSPS